MGCNQEVSRSNNWKNASIRVIIVKYILLFRYSRPSKSCVHCPRADALCTSRISRMNLVLSMSKLDTETSEILFENSILHSAS